MRKSKLVTNKISFYITVDSIRSKSNCSISIYSTEFVDNKGIKEKLSSISEQINIDYPHDLIERLKDWQKLHLAIYARKDKEQNDNPESRALPSEPRETKPSFRVKYKSSGSSSLSKLVTELNQAEKTLLDQFNVWVNLEDFLKIRNYILNKIGIPTNFANVEDIQLNYDNINIYISCKDKYDLSLAKLPWERWNILPKLVREQFSKNIKILRTINNPSEKLAPISAHKKPKFLVLIGQDCLIDFQKEKSILQKLQSTKKAELNFLDASQHHSSREYCEKLSNNLRDDRGWDGIFIVAHSSENSQGGKIKISSDISFNLEDFRNDFIYAKSRGLRFAFLNSCEGLNIAHFLVDIGLHQVLFMREKVHNEIAERCSKILVDNLVDGYGLHLGFQKIKEFLLKNNSIYPSAYLIPTLFENPSFDSDDFRLRNSEWKYFRYNFLPQSKKEVIALTSILLLSITFPVQDFLIDLRLATQAIAKIPFSSLIKKDLPLIQVITIDQNSIDQANLTYPLFDEDPIDRRYLADIIGKLRSVNSPVIGIDYLLYKQTEYDEQLKNALDTENKDTQSWFILANAQEQEAYSLDIFRKTRWVIQSDGDVANWEMQRPRELDCDGTCPFAFMLASSWELQKKISTNNLKWINRKVLENDKFNLQQQIQNKSFALNLSDDKSKRFGISLSSNQRFSTFGKIKKTITNILNPYSLLDYSIPPFSIYEEISAKDFLESGTTEEFKQKYQNRTVIITSGDYKTAINLHYSRPLAMDIWCSLQNRQNRCDRLLTSGEIQAYSTYHYLKNRNLRQVSFLWTTIFSIILGKGIQVYLFSLDMKSRNKFKEKIKSIIMIGGVINILIFMILNLSVPYSIPAIVVLTYIHSSLKIRNSNE